MPTWDGLLTTITLGRVLVLSHDALQVQFAGFLEHGDANAVYMVSIYNRRNPVTEHTLQLVFPVHQLILAKVFSADLQKIKRNEARLLSAE